MVTAQKCMDGNEPRIIATQEFIDKNKFKLRTQEEILEKYKKGVEGVYAFGFDLDILLHHISYETIFTKTHIDTSNSSKSFVDNTLEATQDFLDYMVLFWKRIQDDFFTETEGRKIFIVNCSFQKLSAWLWLLNREDLESKIKINVSNQFNPQPHLIPALIEVCNTLEIKVPESLIKFSKNKC